MKSQIIALILIVAVLLIATELRSIYKDNQPFRVEVVNYDQSSGNNQIHFSSNKEIGYADAWIEKDGKKVYEGGFGDYTKNGIATDIPGGQRMVVYVPYAEELPQPGRYYVKVRFMYAQGDKYEQCLVTTDVRLHDQLKPI